MTVAMYMFISDTAVSLEVQVLITPVILTYRLIFIVHVIAFSFDIFCSALSESCKVCIQTAYTKYVTCWFKHQDMRLMHVPSQGHHHLCMTRCQFWQFLVY